MIQAIKSFLGIGADEAPKDYPYRYAKVEFTPIAKANGVMDDDNRIIKIFEGGQIVKQFEYSKQLVDAIISVDRIPVYVEKLNDEEDFEFYPLEDLGSVKYSK